MRKTLTTLAALFALAAAGPALAADDGFKPFFAKFIAAIGKDDVKAASAMIRFPIPIGATDVTPDNVAARWNEVLPPDHRSCIAKADPIRDTDADGNPNYMVFCDDSIYVFSQIGGQWQMSDIGAND